MEKVIVFKETFKGLDERTVLAFINSRIATVDKSGEYRKEEIIAELVTVKEFILEISPELRDEFKEEAADNDDEIDESAGE